MENIRTSTLVLHNNNKDSIRSAQKNIAKISNQVTSGIESRDFHGISHKTSIENHLINKNAKETLDGRIQNNTFLTSKMNSIEGSVMGLQDVVRDGLVLAVRARSAGPGSGLDTQGLAKQYLSKVHNLMQTQFNGQYLFSGSDIRTIPVNDFVNTSNLVSGNVTTNYYLGNNDQMISKISDTGQVEYGFKANDPAVSKLVGAFHKMIEGYSLNDSTKYTEAVDLLNESKIELSSYTARLGNSYAQVDEQLKLDKSLSLKLNELISDVESVDIPTAMADMVNSQVKLQASYMLLVRANSITLADYLR
jgi:flagellar hook-associated protein 3 FlgL